MIAGLSVLALITARGGSKGIPGKNLADLGGRPLIGWTIAAARESRFIDRLVLSSDDASIIAAARQLGCEAPFVRPAELASDNASSVDVVADALARLPAHDLLVLLQPTSPLRSAADIDATLQRLVDADAPACVTVCPAEVHPYWSFRLGAAGRLERFVELPQGLPARRQDLPPAWCLNGAVYAARSAWFLRERSFLAAGTIAWPMPSERSIDIDTPADLDRARLLVASAATHASATLPQPEPRP